MLQKLDGEKSHYRVIILGSGAAGFTAAIYAARANLEPLVIEDLNPAGNSPSQPMLKIILAFQTESWGPI